MAVLVEALDLLESLRSVDGGCHVGFRRIYNVECLVRLVLRGVSAAAALAHPVAHRHVDRVALALLGLVLALVVEAHALGVDRGLCAAGTLDS